MITPVLLCGGSGSRLWPMSRKSFPKQFSALLGEKTLLQNTALRFQAEEFGPPLMITADEFRFIVTEQLAACEIAPHSILIEPQARNTAPAALAAALHLAAENPQSLLLLSPCDHAIETPELFRHTVLKGVGAAQAGHIVAFGIRPTRAETGYGWLEINTATPAAEDVRSLVRFIEKPKQDVADTLFKTPQFLWNSGVFLASAQTIITAFQTHAPDIFGAVFKAVEQRKKDLGFMRLDSLEWTKVPNISIDYAIMEKQSDLRAVPYEGSWSDLGSWDAVWQESDKDLDGNAVQGAVAAIECTNSLLHAQTHGLQLVGIGLDNVVAIAMNDAVMVADMTKMQSVAKAVVHLKAHNVKQATAFPIDNRPWGWFETLIVGDRFQVKRIHIKPQASLSLQKHLHRAEHWIVTQGTALATVDGKEQLISENEALYVPLGVEHRLQNPGKLPVVLIEVQTGAYLGEDDIIRLEDVYQRGDPQTD